MKWSSCKTYILAIWAITCVPILAFSIYVGIALDYSIGEWVSLFNPKYIYNFSDLVFFIVRVLVVFIPFAVIIHSLSYRRDTQ